MKGNTLEKSKSNARSEDHLLCLRLSVHLTLAQDLVTVNVSLNSGVVENARRTTICKALILILHGKSVDRKVKRSNQYIP
jgi:hypothetical protein